MIDNYVVAAIVLPAIVAVFKTQITNLFTAWSIYHLRTFDLDGNPDTPDKVQIMHRDTGEWIDVIIEKYLFWSTAKKRGVYLLYPDGGRERVSFIVWAGFRKRTPPPSDKIR